MIQTWLNILTPHGKKKFYINRIGLLICFFEWPIKLLQKQPINSYLSESNCSRAIMGYRYRSIICFWISIIVILIAPLPALSDETKTHLKVAVLQDFPPQYSLSEAGTPEGFAIDVIAEIARLADADIQFVVKTNWTEMFNALRSGEVDLIPNMGITDQRKGWFAFTSPVETFPVRIFVRGASKDIHSINDLAGKKVGVVKLNAGERMVANKPDIQPIAYDHIKDALFDLLAGHLDAMVFPEPVLRLMARRAGLEDRIATVGSPLIEIKRAISVRKDNQALLKGLDDAVIQFVGSPSYERIYSKWYGEPPPLFTIRQLTGIMGIALVVVVTVMALWRYLSLVRINADLACTVEERKEAEKRLQSAHDQLEDRVRERTESLVAANIQLRESEKRYSSLVKNSPDILYRFSENEGGFFVSRKVEDILGYKADYLMENPFVWNESIHPADKGIVMDAISKANQGCAFDIEYRIKDANNNWRWFRDRSIGNVNKTGDVVIEGLASDITEKKLADQEIADSRRQLNDIIEFLPDPTWVIDLKGRVIAWNLAMERVTGIQKEQIVGKGEYAYAVPFYGRPRPLLIDLVLKRDKNWESKYLSIRDNDAIIMESESYHPSMGDGGRYFAGTAGRLYGAQGNVVGAIETIRDITHAKRTEQEREALITELKEALEEVRTLSGLLPMCAKCKKVRDDKGYWSQLETYISQHTDANVTHGYCPECMDEMYSGQHWYEKGKQKGRL